MDTVARLAFASAGALIGIVAPRFRHVSTMVFSTSLAIAVAIGVLLWQGAEIWMAAAVLPLLAFATLAVTRWLPRLGTAPMLALALALAVLTVTGGHDELRRPAAGAAVVLLIAGTWKPRWGGLLACATFGASLAWGVGPLVGGIGAWAATLAAYLALGGLAMALQGREPPAPPWPRCLRWAATVAAALIVSVLALPHVAQPLPAAGEAPVATRLTRLREQAPRGGLVWPLPSEALLWGENDLPAFENLDALYLGGAADAGLVKAPGTLPLRSRLALNGAVRGLRAIKDESEIDLLRRAARATVEALRRTLPLYHDGGYEGAIAELVRYNQGQLGCEGDSFPPIVASGANAVDFHYMKNDAPLFEGDLVVTDIGCYVEHYASDFTRTLPVGGRFTPRARELYEAVYEAEHAAARACRAGVYLLARGAPDGATSLDAIARQTLEARGVPSDFGYGIGHGVGLFVHDVTPRAGPLESGMVITIEPGVYIESEGIGVRIENVYVVRDDHCELITKGFPTRPDDVERMMARASGSFVVDATPRHAKATDRD